MFNRLDFLVVAVVALFVVFTMPSGAGVPLVFDEPTTPLLRVVLNGKEVLVGRGRNAPDPDQIWIQNEDIELTPTSDFEDLQIGDSVLEETLVAAENNEIRVEIERGGMSIFRSLRIVRKEGSKEWKLLDNEFYRLRFIRRDDADVYFDRMRE